MISRIQNIIRILYALSSTSDGTCLIETLILEQKGREIRKAIEVGPEAQYDKAQFSINDQHTEGHSIGPSEKGLSLLMSFT